MFSFVSLPFRARQQRRLLALTQPPRPLSSVALVVCACKSVCLCARAKSVSNVCGVCARIKARALRVCSS
jgi:hypothetical protein